MWFCAMWESEAPAELAVHRFGRSLTLPSNELLDKVDANIFAGVASPSRQRQLRRSPKRLKTTEFRRFLDRLRTQCVGWSRDLLGFDCPQSDSYRHGLT